jgi:hypothetical protein
VKKLSFGWKSGDTTKAENITDLDTLDQVNSYGLVSNTFDNADADMAQIEHSIEVHGTI